MGFASDWLDEWALFHEFIKEAPHDDTGIIVVVPAYNESGITYLLDSLYQCNEPVCKAEVIIVVNAPADADTGTLRINEESLRMIESWKKQHPHCFFRLFAFNIVKPPFRKWGVGFARKSGMDEAVRRFNRIGRPEGVIVNLDADCRVEGNYFISIEQELLVKPERSACSIYFEHPLSGTDYLEDNYFFITRYELHLRYYLQGIKYAGYPFPFHTVGSAFAIKALAYIRAGGMNRRQAGEDFYFIQKLVPGGGYFSLNSTTVYPAPRASLRVPFGTGATISRLIGEKRCELPAYNVKAFIDLHDLFMHIDDFYLASDEVFEKKYSEIPRSVRFFIDPEEFSEKINEISKNTSGLRSFRKRFFGWFNMFRIVKYMNAVHQEYYEKVPVNEAASELLKITGLDPPSKDAIELLKIYRDLEKNAP